MKKVKVSLRCASGLPEAHLKHIFILRQAYVNTLT